MTFLIPTCQEVHGLFLDYFLHSSTLVNSEEISAMDWDPNPQPPEEKCCVTIDVNIFMKFLIMKGKKSIQYNTGVAGCVGSSSWRGEENQ